MPHQPETKNCQNCKTDFVIEPDDFGFYEKMQVPVPTFCSECRLQRRMGSRNERVLYRRECGLCNKKLLALYSLEEPYVVYCTSCWWGDGWDPSIYAKEYDFSKNFFEQYAELKKSVPHENLYQSNFVNSDYSNFGLNHKDCYLVMGGWDNERLYYASQVNGVSDSFDIYLSSKLELSYDSILCSRSSKLLYCNSCEDSSDLFMCTDCRGCVSCFRCTGLRNKMYHIFNKPYSKEDYINEISKFKTNSYSEIRVLRDQFKTFSLSFPVRFSQVRNAVDCTGDNIFDSKNAKYSFLTNQVEDVKYSVFVSQQKDTYDSTYIGKGGGEMLYEVISSFGGSKQIVGVRTLFDEDTSYSDDCHNCSNIFGCIGLKKKSYMIFNKEYSKEDYFKIREKIINHMKVKPYLDKKGRSYVYGDFWPIELSPFTYNETKAQEHFPLTKEEALEKGYRWRDRVFGEYKISFEAKNLPDLIDDVEDGIEDGVIECEHVGKCVDNCTVGFKILKSELEFYRRMKLPLPRLCPNCRHMDRVNRANPFKLWDRVCMCDKQNHTHGEGKCEVEFKTSYSPDSPEIVYCEKCYQQEVY